jgi:hypothetical protein
LAPFSERYYNLFDKYLTIIKININKKMESGKVVNWKNGKLFNEKKIKLEKRREE